MDRSAATWGRRSFLGAMGVGGAALVLGRTLRARADVTALPKRVVVVVTGHGNHLPAYRIADPGGAPAAAPYQVALPALAADRLSPILAPFADFRDRMLALDGLSMTSAMADESLNEHVKGQIHALTGAPFVARESSRGADATATSMDRILGARNHRPGTYETLNLGIGTQNVVYDDAGRLVSPRTSPVEVHRALFGDLMGDTAEQERGRRLSRGRREIFAQLDRQYARVASQLIDVPRARLDVHRTLLGELAARMTALEGATCAAPGAPTDDRGPSQLRDPASWRERMQTWSDVIGAAFACDLTRTVVLQLEQLPTAVFGAPPDGDMHAAYAHPVWTSTSAQSWMEAYNRTHAEQIAVLLRTLDAIPEGDGTMLDHTLVYWANELADGNHGYRGYTATLFGGQAFTGWSMGRYVRFAPTGMRPRSQPGWVWTAGRTDMFSPWTRAEPGLGPAHGRLLTSIAQTIDPSIESIGLRTCEGADCVERPATFGTIDLSSPLSELRG